MIFIAEIGLNHNGNFGLIYELIKQASLSGADYAKFQFGWRSNKDEINALTEKEIQHIIQTCKYFNIKPLLSIFNTTSWRIAKKYNFDSFKIASRTVVDEPELVQEIIANSKSTIVSLGMWDKQNELPFTQEREKIKYLWCKSKYPSYPWDLGDLPKNFHGTNYDGLSDHSVGIEIPLIAISRGAKIIEKHFTLDKSDTTIRDHALSATPDEFSKMVELGRAIENALIAGV